MRAAALEGKVDEEGGAVAFRGGFLGGRHTLTLTDAAGPGGYGLRASIVTPLKSPLNEPGLGIVQLHEQVLKLLAGLSRHAVCHDHAVAMLRVALEAEQADRLRLRQRDRLAEVEEGLRLLHMLKEDALEAFEVPAARRLAAALRGAESAQVPIADPGVCEMRRELVLGEALLAGDRCCANVEHELDACLAQGAEEGIDRAAFIADGADRFWPHAGSIHRRPRADQTPPGQGPSVGQKP